MAVTVLAPLAYVVFLFGSLFLFSKYYRRRKSVQEDHEPWFPPQVERDIYYSLLSLQTPPANFILTAALLRRAMTDIKRMWVLRESKQALQILLQRGQIGDDLWTRFIETEKEMEAEIVEVVEEANVFKEGWGAQIFNQASEMVSHERLKETFRNIPAEREKETARLAVLASANYSPPATLSLTASVPVGHSVKPLDSTGAAPPSAPGGRSPAKALPPSQTPPPKAGQFPDQFPVSAPIAGPSTPNAVRQSNPTKELASPVISDSISEDGDATQTTSSKTELRVNGALAKGPIGGGKGKGKAGGNKRGKRRK